MAATMIPATEAGWLAVESVLAQDAAARKCWCRWQKWTNAEYSPATPEDRAAALRLDVEGGDSPGIVAYLDDAPVGWCAVQPRTVYRRLPVTKAVAAEAAARGDDLADPDVWAIVCFVVARSARGRGIGHELLAAAVEVARVAGARRVVGYPVDTAAVSTRSAGLNVGTLSMFSRAGFRVVGERGAAKPVVALDL